MLRRLVAPGCVIATLASVASIVLALLFTPAAPARTTSPTVRLEAPTVVRASAPPTLTAARPPSALVTNEALLPGQSLYSPDGRYLLAMQTDGNLVLYSPGGPAIWNTRTNGQPGAFFVMQGDGNAVVYSRAGRAIWFSATAGRLGTSFSVQVDGNLVIRTATAAAVWSSGTIPAAGSAANPRPAPVASPSALTMGNALAINQELVSPNGQYRAIMQGDGNFVLYGPQGALWNTHSSLWPGAGLVMQGDGNLVLYSTTGIALWNTRTNGRAPAWLVVQDDGSLDIVPAVGPVLWNSKTAATPSVPAPPSSAIASGAWQLTGHGNGHGRGMSQYGALARAQAGQSMAQIMAFYYANTTVTAPSSATAQTPVRVLLSNVGSYPTVVASAGLGASVGGPLTTSGATQYRLVPSGAGLAVQALVGSTWSTVRDSLPASTAFTPGSAGLQLVRANGTHAGYRGTISGIRSGAAVIAVNTVGLDDYVRGVAANESPSSWPTAAVQAQVVAARTYARFSVLNVAGAGLYDICDTSSCQVYGGQSTEAATTNAAIDATQGQLVTYGGAPIFAQFSSSNGGWTFDGGKPYLIAQPDPYDKAGTDPWFSWNRTVSVASVAAYYGLTSISALRITGRNGHGDWGGAVTSARLDGVRAGVATTISVTGTSLRSAMNLPLEWFTITN